MSRKLKEIIIRNIFFLTAMGSVFVLGLIMVFLFREAIPIFRTVSVFNFLFGPEWYPTYKPPEFGIWPLDSGLADRDFFLDADSGAHRGALGDLHVRTRQALGQGDLQTGYRTAGRTAVCRARVFRDGCHRPLDAGHIRYAHRAQYHECLAHAGAHGRSDHLQHFRRRPVLGPARIQGGFLCAGRDKIRDNNRGSLCLPRFRASRRRSSWAWPGQ